MQVDDIGRATVFNVFTRIIIPPLLKDTERDLRIDKKLDVIHSERIFYIIGTEHASRLVRHPPSARIVPVVHLAKPLDVLATGSLVDISQLLVVNL
jgi:hypothetical protein